MTDFLPPAPERITGWVRDALAEDAAGGDATVSFLALGDQPVTGEVRVAAPTVVCGTSLAREAFRQCDANARVEVLVEDGMRAEAGAVVVRVHGGARAVVTAERTALNFLQHLSGVATLTARYVAAVAGSGVTILDTRKTIPLWRDLEKYAVRCGGGTNHRRDLGAMVLVKDNHVRALGGREALLHVLDETTRSSFVEVEVDSLAFFDQVLERRVNRIMLDNFTPAQVAEALERLQTFRTANPRLRIEIEVSGGITLDTVQAYALPGVDFISVGALTHSAPAASMSLDVL